MKISIDNFFRIFALLAVVSATLNVAAAQTTTTVSATGIVREVTAEKFSLQEAASTSPNDYTWSTDMIYVDESGNALSSNTLRVGLPVTVFYSFDGDRRVVSKVIVRTAAPAPVTENAPVTQPVIQPVIQPVTQLAPANSSQGVVSSFGPNSISLKSDLSATPLTYDLGKTTTFVDENGQPVSVATVKSGLPVTVYYERDGDLIMATQVVVTKSMNPPASATAHVPATPPATDPNPK